MDVSPYEPVHLLLLIAVLAGSDVDARLDGDFPEGPMMDGVAP